jgi:hypothetical protein
VHFTSSGRSGIPLGRVYCRIPLGSVYKAMAASSMHSTAPSQLTVSRSPKDQCNIDPSRSVDAGSAACPLIASHACIFALFKDWRPSAAQEFENIVLKSVKEWDATGAPVNGSQPADVFEKLAQRYSCKVLIPVRGSCVSRAVLELMVREYKRPFSVLITGIPKSVSYGTAKTWTGGHIRDERIGRLCLDL